VGEGAEFVGIGNGGPVPPGMDNGHVVGVMGTGKLDLAAAKGAWRYDAEGV